MENYKMLLLGGAGFLGAGLSGELVRRGYDVTSLDRIDMDLSDPGNVPRLASVMAENGFTHVFLLAARVGAGLFETSPAEAGLENRKIYECAMSALLASGLKRVRLFYYSTSEVYWSMHSPDVHIDDHMLPGVGIDYRNPRSAYARAKLYAERDLKSRFRLFGPDELEAAVVLRPFNVFGLGQRRGVVRDMLSSGLEKGVIRYSEDTTRTFTELSYVSSRVADMVDKTGFRAVNLSDGFSTDMETLAGAMRKFLKWKFGKDVSLEASPPDKSIRYRQASDLVRDPDAVFEIMRASSDMNMMAWQAADNMEGSL